MKLEAYISDLLYEHDCVIVPDFGGFVCNYAPAHNDELKHLFEPPSKKIMFNKTLTRNDGLLAHYVSGKMNLTYAETLNTIAGEVKHYKDALRTEKRLGLENIGILYLDENGNTLFRQDNKKNYLTESFGLASFYRLPVENAGTQNEKDNVVRIPIRREKKKAPYYAAAAAIAAIATAAFYFTLLEKPNNITGRFSSLNFFNKKETAQYVFSSSLYTELPKNLPFINVPAIAPAQRWPIYSNTDSNFYSIVIGSFRLKENAENLVNQFEKQNAGLYLKDLKGIYLVGFGKFTSHDEAVAQRDSLRKGIAKDAWITTF